MTRVSTALGPVDGAEPGRTYVHEHLFPLPAGASVRTSCRTSGPAG